MYIHNYAHVIMFVCVWVCDDRTVVHVDRLAGIRDLMRLQIGVRSSRLVTFAAIRLRDHGFNPGQARAES